LTTHDYIDEVKLRLQRNKISVSLSDTLVLTLVNRARRQVQKATIGLYPERYGRIWIRPIFAADLFPLYNQSNPYSTTPLQVLRVQLPVDILQVEVCILSYWDDEQPTYRNECRYQTKWEMFNAHMNAFAVPTKDTPLYNYERDLSVTPPLYFLYVSGIEDGVAQTIIDTYANRQLEIWYTAALPDLENLPLIEADTVIPAHLQELVILYASLFAMQMAEPTASLTAVIAEIQRIEAMAKDLFTVEMDVSPSLLPSKEGL